MINAESHDRILTSYTVEYIVGKGENDCHRHFMLFSQCFFFFSGSNTRNCEVMTSGPVYKVKALFRRPNSLKLYLLDLYISLKFKLRCVEKGLNTFAKSIDPRQPAQSAQADMDRNFSLNLHFKVFCVSKDLWTLLISLVG